MPNFMLPDLGEEAPGSPSGLLRVAGLIDHGAFKLSPSTSSFVMGPVAVWAAAAWKQRKGLERKQAVSAPHTQPDNFWSGAGRRRSDGESTTSVMATSAPEKSVSDCVALLSAAKDEQRFVGYCSPRS